MTPRSPRPDVINLADEDRANDVVLGALLGLWDVVNNLTRLRPSRRERYCVTIFGSARAAPRSFGYEETRRAAAALAAMGCDIVTSGGPGLMQAANEGASTAPERAMLAFDPPLADAEDLTIPRCVASADEALAIIEAHHATWLRARSPGRPG